MIRNEFVTSEQAFVPMAKWDACVDPRLGPAPANRGVPIYVGVDASVKHDSSAVVATTWDARAQQVRLIFHRIFQPTPDSPLDFEETIEAALLYLQKHFLVARVLFDPYQMVSTAQRLARAGLQIEEYPQSPANLTAASQNLFELISGGNLVAYPDAAMRLAVSRAVAIESSRGWRISKDRQTHKIDVVVALAMSALAAVRGQAADAYRTDHRWVFEDDDDDNEDKDGARAWRLARFRGHLRACGMPIW